MAAWRYWLAQSEKFTGDILAVMGRRADAGAAFARAGYRIVGTSTSCTHALKAEYREMPCLSLTKPQMQRLWGLEAFACDAVVDALVVTGSSWEYYYRHDSENPSGNVPVVDQLLLRVSSAAALRTARHSRATAAAFGPCPSASITAK